MRAIHFHALKDDLLLALQLVESTGPLKYVRTGNFLKDEVKDGITFFACGAQIPNLGNATADSSVACESFLVCEQSTPVNLRTFQGNDRVERVCVDQFTTVRLYVKEG